VTSLQTEFSFVLPTGYLDSGGELHKEGRMRLATAADEILPLKDPRVQGNPAYLAVILLSRVVTALGSVEIINPKVIEGLFAGDLGYLQDFYNKINGSGLSAVKVACPFCEQHFEVEVEATGESQATPSISSTRR
jgi:hypothetical protein